MNSPMAVITTNAPMPIARALDWLKPLLPGVLVVVGTATVGVEVVVAVGVCWGNPGDSGFPGPCPGP